MRKDVRLLFLKILKYNGDLLPLINLGYNYCSISELLTDLINGGLAENIQGRLILTELGNNEILKLSKELNKKKNDWIEPKIDAKIQIIDENFIYLPNKQQLSFLKE